MEKKKWSRPECEKVRLIPEEAVITGCKVSGTSGIGNTNRCSAGVGGGNPCSSLTS